MPLETTPYDDLKYPKGVKSTAVEQLVIGYRGRYYLVLVDAENAQAYDNAMAPFIGAAGDPVPKIKIPTSLEGSVPPSFFDKQDPAVDPLNPPTHTRKQVGTSVSLNGESGDDDPLLLPDGRKIVDGFWKGRGAEDLRRRMREWAEMDPHQKGHFPRAVAIKYAHEHPNMVPTVTPR